MTQGLQDRSTLPEWFVALLDKRLGEPLVFIEWESDLPNILYAESDGKRLKIDLSGTAWAV